MVLRHKNVMGIGMKSNLLPVVGSFVTCCIWKKNLQNLKDP
jgi:hypothetical protein